MTLIFLSHTLNIPSLENKPNGILLSILQLHTISSDAFMLFKSFATIIELSISTEPRQ